MRKYTKKELAAMSREEVEKEFTALEDLYAGAEESCAEMAANCEKMAELLKDFLPVLRETLLRLAELERGL